MLRKWQDQSGKVNNGIRTQKSFGFSRQNVHLCSKRKANQRGKQLKIQFIRKMAVETLCCDTETVGGMNILSDWLLLELEGHWGCRAGYECRCSVGTEKVPSTPPLMLRQQQQQQQLCTTITRRCLNGTAPQYLAAHCVPVSATELRQHLRSAASHQLVVPSYWLSSYRRRTFSVVGPTTWKSLPKQLRDPVHTTSIFGRLLKTFLFSEY